MFHEKEGKWKGSDDKEKWELRDVVAMQFVF